MTIESSPTSTTGPMPPRTAGAAGRSGHGAAQSEAATGLFSSVLTGLTETLTPNLATAALGAFDLAALPGKVKTLVSDPGTVLDAAAQALLAQFLGMGISPVTPAQSGNDAAAALPLAASVLAMQVPGPSIAPPAVTTLPGTMPIGATDALPWSVSPESLQAFKVPPAGVDDGVGLGEIAAAGPLAAHSLAAVDAAARGAAALADADAASPGAPSRSGQSAVRLALANAQGLVKWQQTQSEQTMAAATLSGASARDVFTDQALQPSARAADSAALPGVVTAVGGSEAQVMRQRERSSAGPGASRFEPMNLSGAVVPAFVVGPTAAPAPAAAPLAASLAEQVKYWMTNDIRNAELQLDGLGTEPVQVSITMSGNEAQVVFRSDQAQTRELLGNAMGQLEQLLRGEGLALAGAWVGASGQQAGSGAGAQQDQAGSRPMAQGMEQVATSAVAGATGRRVVPAERVLDLFA